MFVLLISGGILRKGFYSALAMVAAGALCYPNQALDISEQTCTQVKQKAYDLWEQKPSTSEYDSLSTTVTVLCKRFGTCDTEIFAFKT
jgi:hypothetical protein